MDRPRPSNLSPIGEFSDSRADVDERVGRELAERLGRAPSLEAKLQYVEAKQAIAALEQAREGGDLSPADEAALQVLSDRLSQIGSEEHVRTLASDAEGLAQKSGVQIEKRPDRLEPEHAQTPGQHLPSYVKTAWGL